MIELTTNSFWEYLHSIGVDLGDITTPSDRLSDIIYCPTEASFRIRSERIGYVKLPFMNFYITNIEFDFERFNRKASSYRRPYDDGLFIPELSRKFYGVPINLTYEVNYWAHEYSRILQVVKNHYYQWRMSNEELEVKVPYESTEFKIAIKMDFQDPDIDPSYNGLDQYTKGIIHSVSLTYIARTWVLDMPITDGNVIEQIILKIFDDRELEHVKEQFNTVYPSSRLDISNQIENV